MERRYDVWTYSDSGDGTVNIFLYKSSKLVRKIWIYPDGSVTYKDFPQDEHRIGEIEVIAKIL